MVMADSGEDAIVFCDKCQYAANLEKAEVAEPEKKKISEKDWLPLESVHTPEVRTIEESVHSKSQPQEYRENINF